MHTKRREPKNRRHHRHDQTRCYYSGHRPRTALHNPSRRLTNQNQLRPGMRSPFLLKRSMSAPPAPDLNRRLAPFHSRWLARSTLVYGCVTSVNIGGLWSGPRDQSCSWISNFGLVTLVWAGHRLWLCVG